MMIIPIFPPLLQVEVADEAVFFRSEHETAQMSGAVYVALVPLIDGRRSSDELVDLLMDRFSAAELYYALMHLEQKKWLIEATPELSERVVALLSSLPVELPTAAKRLLETTVSVQAFGSADPSRLLQALEHLSVRVVAEGDFQIVLTDEYLRDELSAHNVQSLATGCPWLLAKPSGASLWIGPVIRPHETGCYECLAQRLRSHRQANGPVRMVKQAAPLPLSHAGVELIALEALKAIVLGDQYEGNGSMLSFDLLTLHTTRHALVHRPQCPVCGDAETPHPAQSPILLTAQTKQTTVYGGDRAVAPEETLRRYGHHISPITGIISRFERAAQTEIDGPVHSYLSGFNMAVRLQDNAASLNGYLRVHSGGKGVNELQAKTGALCEALERYSGRFQGDEPRERATMADLGERAIHPNRCLLFSEAQYDRREEFNRQNQLPGRHVPLRFDEQAVHEWTPVWSLTAQTFKYLPTSYCFYQTPSPNGEISCPADSNGCAAGNTVEEAILQGFLELVERDSVAIWWYNRLTRGEVDADSFGLPYVKQLRDYYRSVGREFWVLDVTSDLGIPTLVAVSRAVDSVQEEILFGFGAHFNPEIALLRALTEMNQFLPAVLRWHQHQQGDGVTECWWKTATVGNQPYLRPDPDVAVQTRDDFHYVAESDIRADVLRCQAIAESQGLEMLVLNQTRPDVGLPVVKVIVPGLRHFWNRFAPGRLYEVPVRMGWLSRPLHEEELNPLAMFL